MIYICGDSFCVSDPEYGPCWVDLMADRFSITNLAQVAATNLLIAQQVDRALEASPEFIIMHATAVTRSEKRVNDVVIPFSYHTAGPDTTPFDLRQLCILKDYFLEFFDIETAVYQNSITIEHTLQKLLDSRIPFLFDQGGFEHSAYKDSKTGWFSKYHDYRSKKNLWDYARTRNYRPYYHITDMSIHQEIADYYTREINTRI